MIGLALEGGGAKGAFHMGAVKALLEEGWKFDGVVGTSIGAFNGAMIAQGDFDKCYEIWENMDASTVFDLEENQIKKLLSKTLDRESLSILSSLVKDIIDNRGVDTALIRQLLETNVDEEKLRNSPMDFGLVTVSVTDLKAVELFKEEIPQGLMTSYIMASANFPIFKLEPLEGKLYVDGGFYDNCPINLLLKKGYDRIVAVRTLGMGMNRKIDHNGAEIITILPSEDLGRLFYIDKEIINRNMKIGYFDTMRVLKGLKGKKYYLTEGFDEEELFKKIGALKINEIEYISDALNIENATTRRIFFERTIPKMAEFLDIPEGGEYSEVLIGLLEYLAESCGIDRLQYFKANELLQQVQAELHRDREKRNELEKGRIKSIGAMNRKKRNMVFARPVVKSIARRIENSPLFSKELIIRRTASRLFEVLT